MILLEGCFAVLAVVAALVAPTLTSAWFETLESRIKKFAQRRALAVATVGVAAVVGRLAVLPMLPIPYPGIPDEFGHLLAADTFSHLRVTNPTHPMWMYFENLSEIQRPSYASKYPPAQGMILAIGQLIFGHPFWGVCLSVGLMCGAICWMLQGWLPPAWALIGGVLAVVRLGIFSYWSNSYWGGAMAALGGALVLGALPRIKVSQRLWDALIFALGIAILANSRPYEGLALCVPVFVYLVIWMFELKPESRRHARRCFVLPAFISLFLAALATGYYCWRVTGSPTLTPYQVAQDTYYPTPLFLVQPLRHVHLDSHPDIENDLRTWELAVYQGGRQHPILTIETRIFFLTLFYFGPALCVPFLVLPYVLPARFSWRDISGDTQFLLVVVAVAVAASLLPLFFNPGYCAPVTAAIYALVLKSVRRVRSWAVAQKPTGLAFSRYLALCCLALVVVRIAAGPLHVPLYGPRTWASLDRQLLDRQRIQTQLEQAGGQNLIIVHYAENHAATGTEWVFNDADIDASKIVWARDMGAEANLQLTKYFNHRTAWILEPDATPPVLRKFSAGSGVGARSVTLQAGTLER